MKHDKGFSILEVMISSLLSIILITALVVNYLSIKKQYTFVNQTLYQKLDLALIENLIRDSIRRAGFTPCLNLNLLKRGSHPLLTSIQTNAGKNKALRIMRMSEYFDLVSSLRQRTVIIATNRDYKLGSEILIADCKHVEVQKIVGIRHSQKHNTIISVKKDLSFNYDLPTYVGEFIQEDFFIHENQAHTLSLYYQTKHEEELTRKITSLSASLHSHNPPTLVTVTLGLDNSEELTIDTAVRTA